MNQRLSIGANHALELDPKHHFIPTGVFVQAGERHRLAASGKWQDWFKDCDAKGWNLFGMGWMRRHSRFRGANWFALIACVGANDKTCRLIGKQDEIDVADAGHALEGIDPIQLYVFANDWPCLYFNNRVASVKKGGPMRLTITRLA